MCFNLYPAWKSPIIPRSRNLFRNIRHISTMHNDEESRTINIVFYSLCLLYILSTATVLSDLLEVIFEASNNSIYYKNNTFISYTVACQFTTSSISDRLTVNVLSHFNYPNHIKRLLWLQCPVHIGMHKIILPTICFIHLNLQRSTVVGLCGVKISR